MLRSTSIAILEQLETANSALFRMAETLAKEANSEIASLSRRAVRSPGIALSARSRRGFWGPRLVWVRIGGPRQARIASSRGQRGEWVGVARVTREIPMPDGLSVHMNVFEGMEEPIRSVARDYEVRAREIREAARVYRETYHGATKVIQRLESRRAAEARSGSGMVRRGHEG